MHWSSFLVIPGRGSGRVEAALRAHLERRSVPYDSIGAGRLRIRPAECAEGRQDRVVEIILFEPRLRCRCSGLYAF